MQTIVISILLDIGGDAVPRAPHRVNLKTNSIHLQLLMYNLVIHNTEIELKNFAINICRFM